MKNFLLIILFTLVFILLILIVRPVNISRENSIFVNGVICSVTMDSTKTKDIVIHLCDDRSFYLIDLGMEHDPPLDVLNDLIGKQIEIAYAKHWSPLNPSNDLKLVIEVAVMDSIIYSQL